MSDAETYWVVAAGAVGLFAFAIGSVLPAVPPIDATMDDVLHSLQRNRARILAGSVLAPTGAALLLWPISAVATTNPDQGWASLRAFSIAVAVLGFAFVAISSVAMAALAWRDPKGVHPSTVRLVLDGCHLAIWSVSAPIGAALVLSTTAVGVQAGLFGPFVVVAAALKTATVVLEVIGIGQRAGWNAGGWAAGSSGYATVAWFGFVLFALL